MKRTVFSICSANYLPTVKVLFDSLARHEPASRRVLVLAERNSDDEHLAALGDLLQCEVWPLSRLALPDVQKMAFQYDIIEFNTAIKPFVFQALFNEQEQSVIYLDPDICLYASLSSLWDVLASHEAVVTPHITRPLPDDGLAPSNENMIRCGQYNFGFVGFANKAHAKGFVDWWAQRLEDHCIFHPQHFYFVDQFYGSLVSSFIPDTCVWAHHGYNFAYWNAGQRSLKGNSTEGWLTDDGPLVFFHFSGFTHSDPDELSRHQNRLRADEGSALSRIAHEYASAVALNIDAVKDYVAPYSFDHYDNGERIDRIERLAFRDLAAADKQAFADPFRVDTRDQLVRYQQIDDVEGSSTGLIWQLWQRQNLLEDAQRDSAALRDQLEHSRQESADLHRQLAASHRHTEQQRADLQAIIDALHRQCDELRYPASLRWIRGRAHRSPRYLWLRRRLSDVLRYRRHHGTRQTALAVVRKVGQRVFKWPVPSPAVDVGHRAQRLEPLTTHTESVDIIVCIHNAFDDVTRCLHSVVRYTVPPYRLILVDDGSDETTKQFVEGFAKEQGAVHIRNQVARGYTLAANQGMRASDAQFVVLLNSDTIVTPLWLDRMLRCARSSPKIGVIGPLSNAASWQSVPETFDAQGDWSDNVLPPGLDLVAMAQLVADQSGCQYPRVGFVNGFCYMIRRELLDQIGMFDEETFAKGYGEENDFSLRTVAAGWQLAIADDAYVHHAQSKSYSNERRQQLAKRADEALIRKHGDSAIQAGLLVTQQSPALAALRARIASALHDEVVASPNTTDASYLGKQVLFVLPVIPSGGGGNVVIHEVRALMSQGVDARIVNLTGNRKRFLQNHPGLDVPVDYIDTPEDLDDLLDFADVVVGTLYVTINWIAASFHRRNEKRVKAAYYIQDFEPYFFKEGSADYIEAWDSYTRIPDLIRLTKTQWNADELWQQCRVDAHVIGCSYDASLFMPARLKHHDAVTRVIAMVRPATPRRAPELTLRVLKSLHEALGDRVHLTIFGCAPDDTALTALDHDFPHTNLGELSGEAVAEALDDHDVFLDYSSYQAMGLTALEAMACGLAVVAPVRGGTNSFIEHEKNGLLVDTSDEAACLEAARRLVTDDALRRRLSEAAMIDAVKHTPQHVAAKMIDVLFGSKP